MPSSARGQMLYNVPGVTFIHPSLPPLTGDDIKTKGRKKKASHEEGKMANGLNF